jgi:hypothetical protein
MKDYQLTNGVAILRVADNASIPLDPKNTDYQTYLEWVAAGNTPDPVNIANDKTSADDYKSMIRRKAETLAAGSLEDKYQSLILLKGIGE